MPEPAGATRAPKGLRAFLVLWSGQVVSVFGSGLSGFTLGVWAYRQTGSATALSLITLFATLPNTVLSPLAGVLIDRWGRKPSLLLNNFGCGACTLIMALLYWSGRLEIWHVYVLVLASRCFNVVQLPAFSTATAQLVPRRHLVRANGLAQIGPPAAQIAAPLLAASLMDTIGIGGVILIDSLSFLFAATTLLAIRIPKPPVSEAGLAARGTVYQEAIYGWHYIRKRTGLLGLLLFFAVANYGLTVVQILLTPLVLGFASTKTLGAVLASATVGGLLGGLVLGVWGGAKAGNRIRFILGFTAFQGATLLLGGLRPNAVLVAVATGIALFASPIIRGSSEAIWQSKVPQDLQGRVFSIRRMIAGVAFPLAGATAGPLADRVFEPALAPGGWLAGSVGALIGVGKGRGIALLIMTFGVLTLLAVLVIQRYRPVRDVESDLPDVLRDPETETRPRPGGEGAPLSSSPATGASDTNLSTARRPV